MTYNYSTNETLEKTVQNIPFLRITLAFAIGIILASNYQFPKLVVAAAILLLLVSLIILHRKFSYKLVTIFGFISTLLVVLLGILVFENYNKQPDFFENSTCSGIIMEKPQEKQNSYKTLVQLNAYKKNDSIIKTKEKILVYFEKTEKPQKLAPGDVILIHSPIQEVKNFGNPYEFDYKTYLKHKRIYRQTYLSDTNWQTTNYQTKNIHIISEQLRDKLLHIYRNQNLGENETEILSALTLGYKRDLDPETKQVFSAAGAMHVLAVSGLHVGIIFIVFTFVFQFLRKSKTGRIVFVITSICLLWSYAFITGLSPSVLRASTMFSLLIIAININRRPNIYNTLASSAMLLLLINPNNLFEVGFQLSYAAVFGIVFLQPRLKRFWQAPNKILDFFWSLLTVSVAAQIATFPLTAFYFNQFPTFFWLTNIIVIPAVTILIPLGILLLSISTVPFLSSGVTFLIKAIINTIYSLLCFIEKLPGSTLDIVINQGELWLLAAVLVCVFIFIRNLKIYYLKTALFLMLFMFTSFLYSTTKQNRINELIVYNNSDNITIQLISGHRNYIICEDTLIQNRFLLQQTQNVTRKFRLKQPVLLQFKHSFQDEYLKLTNNLLYFNGKTLWINQGKKQMKKPFSPDFTIIKYDSKNTGYSENTNTQFISTNYVNTKQTNKKIHSLKTDGAFTTRW